MDNSLLSLWKTTALELGGWCCTSATRDIKTVTSRFEHEGLSFLTITLSNFGQDLQKGLDQGYVDHSLFTGFQFREGLPRFLGGFLDLVFDRASGVLLDNPSVHAIFAIRQLTLMFGKINVPCTKTRERKALLGYIKCEQELKGAHSSESNISDFRRIGSLLFRSSFSRIDHKVFAGEVIPKHGPGSTSDKLSGNGKFNQKTWPCRLESIFSYGEYCLPNWSFYDQLESVEFLEPGSEYPVKVTPVPKTLKTPRIIAMEPTAMQYMQQAVLEVMLEEYESDVLISQFLGFSDQTPNQELAWEGSLTGSLATLDLSEASDRVSNQHVRALVQDFPWLAKALDCTRSRRADVPGFGVIRLSKYASMGSALCFPIEASVFLVLVFLGIERELKTPLDRETISSFIGKVRIYGDDIIVPVEYVRSVKQVLHDFGHKVNLHKSFWTGKFRESCGKEYYDGHDVSIVRVRRMPPTSRKDAAGCIGWVSMRNLFFEKGMLETCQYLDKKIGKVLKYFPVVLPTSPVLGRHEFTSPRASRFDSSTQSPLVKGWRVRVSLPVDPLEDSGALLKWFLKRGEQPFVDRHHLERSGRPLAVNIKLGWGSPY